MFRRKFAFVSMAVLVALILSAMMPSMARAEPPGNDVKENAVAIPSEPMPFNDNLDISDATWSEGDNSACNYYYNIYIIGSVWYSFTPPADGTVYVNTEWSDFNSMLVVRNGAEEVTCSYGFPSYVSFGASGGTTYDIMVASVAYDVYDPYSAGIQKNLHLYLNWVAEPPPSNDDRGSAMPLTLPYTGGNITYMGTTRGATATAEENPDCLASLGYTLAKSVWFRVVPSSPIPSGKSLKFNLTVVPYTERMAWAVYSDSGGDLTPAGCFLGDHQQNLEFPDTLQAYYVQVGSYATDTQAAVPGDFYVVLQVTPPNDNIADAEVITDLPYSGSGSIEYATVEPGETMYCTSYRQQSIWFQYTPAAATTLVLRPNSYDYTQYGVYRGSPGHLELIGCASGNAYWSQNVIFKAEAGQTYYFQAGSDYTNWISFSLEVPPDLQPSFYYNPYTPTIFDTINFNGSVYDPVGGNVNSFQWNFGDGAVANTISSTHHYAKDGDYTVTFTAGSEDGRTKSVSQVVPVRTHDVSVVRFSLPDNVRVGQTRPIGVYIANTRYTENVRVTIYRSTPSGWVQFGYLDQQVKAGPANKYVLYTFNYTFTAEDAAVGKVNFRAVAMILDYIDALPTNNEAISLPVKVRK